MKAPRFMKNKSNLIFSIIEKGTLHKNFPKYLGEVAKKLQTRKANIYKGISNVGVAIMNFHLKIC